MIQVLVKIDGNAPQDAAIHVYDEDRGCAACSSRLKPGGDWEIQERDVERYAQISYRKRCSACLHKLQPKPKPKPPRSLTTLEQRHAVDLEKLRRWTAQ